MPNGRSGGFPIDTTDLKRLVSEVDGSTPIGKIPSTDDQNRRALRPTLGAEVVRLLEDCRHEHVAVEEQDHSFYVVHLRNLPGAVWVMVPADSPLFAPLKKRHEEWQLAHPNWNGWIGF